MADESGEFLELMRRVRAGDDSAAHELYQQYGGHLFRIVRRRLHQPLRSRFDSTDFVQSVWTAFFTAAARDCTFQTPQALISYLGTIAARKVAGAYRRGTQSDKDRIYQLPLETPSPDSEDLTPDHMVSADPTPSQEAVAKERWERLLEGQSVAVQGVLTLRRQGFTIDEIAELLGVAPKTVQRVLRRLEDRPNV